jgi:hypothetical protein
LSTVQLPRMMRCKIHPALPGGRRKVASVAPYPNVIVSLMLKQSDVICPLAGARAGNLVQWQEMWFVCRNISTGCISFRTICPRSHHISICSV